MVVTSTSYVQLLTHCQTTGFTILSREATRQLLTSCFPGVRRKHFIHVDYCHSYRQSLRIYLPCKVTVYALYEKPSSFTTPSCRSCCQTTTEPSAQLQGARTSTWWCQDGMFWERLHERTGWVEKMWWRIALAVGDLNLWEDGDKIFFIWSGVLVIF